MRKVLDVDKNNVETGLCILKLIKKQNVVGGNSSVNIKNCKKYSKLYFL